jgi:hypothetical protein
MNNKLLRNLGGIMRTEIAAISFYLKVIDFFFSSRLIFLNTLFCVSLSRLSNTIEHLNVFVL